MSEVVRYDLLLTETDPSLVGMEMDIGWVIAGGADPVAYLTKQPKRFASVHIKDLKNDGIPNTNGKMVSAIIGTGTADSLEKLPAVQNAAAKTAFRDIEELPVSSPTRLSMSRPPHPHVERQDFRQTTFARCRQRLTADHP